MYTADTALTYQKPISNLQSVVKAAETNYKLQTSMHRTIMLKDCEEHYLGNIYAKESLTATYH